MQRAVPALLLEATRPMHWLSELKGLRTLPSVLENTQSVCAQRPRDICGVGSTQQMCFLLHRRVTNTRSHIPRLEAPNHAEPVMALGREVVVGRMEQHRGRPSSIAAMQDAPDVLRNTAARQRWADVAPSVEHGALLLPGD